MSDNAASPPAWVRVARYLVPVLTLVYGVTLLPGVRGGDGPRFVPWLEIGVGDGLVVVSAVLCLVRAACVPRSRLAWVLLGLGPLAYVAGDLYYYGVLSQLEAPPYPSVADALWLALYPAFVGGFVLLVRDTLRGVRPTVWLDGLTGGFGAAALLGAVVLRPVLSVTGGDLPVVVTNLAYPVCDLALLIVLMLVFNMHGWRPGGVWWLLGFVALTLLLADSVYLLQVASGTYVDGGLLDGAWAIAFSVLGLAAWIPPTDPVPVRHSLASLIVPAVLSIMSTVVLFAGAVQSLPVLVAVFGLLTVLFAGARLTLALLETWRLVVARLEARTDELTGLPNRRRFLELLGDELERGSVTAVMIVDLDRFKQVNDSLGHGVGDILLQVIGGRLESQVRTEDTTVARLGGDEFAVVVRDQDEAVVYTIAARMREVICEPVQLSGVTLAVDASIGIAMSPGHGMTWESLMSKADAAMYVAKRTGSGVEFFTESRDVSGIERLALLSELRDALGDGGLTMHYQPVFSAAGDSVVCIEALVRWPHAHRGMLEPEDFLAVAIEGGLSRHLTDEVLRLVTEQAVRWYADGLQVPVSVNLSQADLADPDLAHRVTSACERAGLPASALQLEITETIALTVMEQAVPLLQLLRERGHVLLLDDFGTGYSSLALLRDLPLDVLKLDRSFHADLDRDGVRTIVSATIRMARELGLTIIAEGVETASALEDMRALGCDGAQGFWLQRPESAEQVCVGLRQRFADAVPGPHPLPDSP